MKKILLPTDFSEVANNAFVHALELANTINGEIVLLHSFDLPIVDNQFYPINYQAIYNTMELSEFETFKDQLPKLREIMQERNLEKIVLSHRLMIGDLVNNIEDCINDEKIDFVVMGTSGASGWKEIFVGTNTADVLATVNIPVLCVPSEAKFQKIDTIGFTTRFREKDRIALLELLTIAKKTNAIIKCLYVQTKESDNTEATFDDWKNLFKNEPVHFFIIPSEDVKDTITDFITGQAIDVLAMLTYKRSFFESIFNHSFTKKLSYNSAIPILALHEKE